MLGVVVRGTARAYPLRILQAHEVANDEIAGLCVRVADSLHDVRALLPIDR